MKSLKKTRRIQIILLAAGALIASFTAFYFAVPNALQFFYSPVQLIEEPPSPNEVIRVGGLVEEGSLELGEGFAFTFSVTDGGATIPVRYEGDEPRPDLFEEGQGTIATGSYVDGVFHATEILAKHDENYMPREVVDALKEQGVYQEASN